MKKLKHNMNIEENQTTQTTMEAAQELYESLPSVDRYYLVNDHELASTELKDFTVSVTREEFAGDENDFRMVATVHHTSGVHVNGTLLDLNKIIKGFETRGINISKSQAILIKELMQDAMIRAIKSHMEFCTYRHILTGWKNGVYYGHGVVGKDIQSTYAGRLLNKSGTLEGWVDAVNQFIVPHVIPSVAMAASFAGIIREKIVDLRANTELMINLVGAPASGKTSLTQIVQTIFTDPYSIIKFNGTLNSRQAMLGERGPMVGCVDDIMQIKGLNRPIDVINMIFQLIDGTTRGRLNLDGSIQKQQSYYGAIIISATSSILMKTVRTDMGQARRLIELKIKSQNDVANSPDDYANMIKAFRENYGHAAEVFAKEVLNLGDQFIMDRFNELKDDYLACGTKALATRYAMISLCAEIAAQSLGINFDLDAIKKHLIMVCKRTNGMFTKRSITIDPLDVEDIIRDYILANPDYFPYGTVKQDDVHKCLGNITVKHGITRVFIPNISLCDGDFERDTVFDSILQGVDPSDIVNDCPMLVVDNLDEIKDYLREAGILQCESKKQKRFTSKGTVISGGKQVHGDKLIIEDFNFGRFNNNMIA